MAPFLGDFNTGQTIHFIWSTNNGAGASVAPSVNGTISVYKNNGVTQSTTGVTDTRGFDGLTGIHACAIDLSSDATFYSAGANFSVVLSAATIDGQSVNAEIAHFSIENRNVNVNVTKFGGTAGTFSAGRPEVNTTHAAGTAWGSGAITAASIAASAFTNTKFASGAIDNTALASGAISSSKLAADTGLVPMRSGTAQAGAAGSITLDASASATNDFYKDAIIVITGGTGAGQSPRLCNGYTGATKVATVTPNWTTNPDATSTFAVIAWGWAPGAVSVTTVTGNVNGNVGGSVASVTGAVGSVTGAVGSVTGNVGGNVVGSVGSVTAAVSTTSNVKKNQALNNFTFLMTDSTNHAPATGKTVTVTRSIDGAAQAAGTLSAVTEIANGLYKVNFGAGDLNGNVIVLRATATGCDDTFERIITVP